MDQREQDQFRRIDLEEERERAMGLVVRYRKAIDFFRRRIDYYSEVIGHLGERLGEAEPDPPREEPS